MPQYHTSSAHSAHDRHVKDAGTQVYQSFRERDHAVIRVRAVGNEGKNHLRMKLWMIKGGTF